MTFNLEPAKGGNVSLADLSVGFFGRTFYLQLIAVRIIALIVLAIFLCCSFRWLTIKNAFKAIKVCFRNIFRCFGLFRKVRTSRDAESNSGEPIYYVPTAPAIYGWETSRVAIAIEGHLRLINTNNNFLIYLVFNRPA
jgi:hypothetical protein